ncbi:MAG: hypothetical protein UZ17_ACD001001302 [Acidobacteria bacterium OLB17]|nr:MAG: hypothetical protein UZ17_ACD001001302 [Acidobacteria bacterium OLB17]MCZ2391697.1 hypothetical protein [Acidobacteriota bacterium]
MSELSQKERQRELAAIFAALEKMNHRLDKLEGKAADAPTLMATETPHPSTDKFSVAEAIADSIFASMKEKACQFEPDKPCDHCSMCNSRGF